MLSNLPLHHSMVNGISTLQGCSQNSDRHSGPGQTAAMRCSINPFGKPTEHRPTRLGESTTKLFGHREAMIRGEPGAHHRNGFAGTQMLE